MTTTPKSQAGTIALLVLVFLFAITLAVLGAIRSDAALTTLAVLGGVLVGIRMAGLPSRGDR